MNNTKGLLYNLATDKKRGAAYVPIKFFLYLVSLIYAAAVKIIIYFCRLSAVRLECRVISIGNITLGGTGKTSLVEYVARRLKGEGRQAAILSRGYKRESIKVSKYQSISCGEMGDEPFMLQQKLKDTAVIVNADRVAGARQAIKDYAADTVILDDGFQQWGLAKDLEIVTIDALNPFGNRHLLPRGILREPLSGLKRADILVLTKTNLISSSDGLKSFLKKINPRALLCESIHSPAGFYDLNHPGQLLNTESLKGERVTLFCGIADPDSFEKLIENLGIKAVLRFRFPDHYNYSAEDFKRITEESREKDIDVLVTTEKDAARFCPQEIGCGLQRTLVLRIEIVIKGDDKERFDYRLLTL